MPYSTGIKFTWWSSNVGEWLWSNEECSKDLGYEW